MRHTIYVDESGHSGRAPLADPAQPVHVCAAVWVTEGELEHLEKSVPMLRKSFDRDKGELKGSRLIKNNGGKKLISALLSELADRKTPISLIVMHKALMAAMILVEDTTDYAFNPKFPVAWTHPIPEKKRLTQAISATMPFRLMAEYLDARKRRNSQEFREAADRLLSALRLGLPDHSLPLTLMLSADFEDILQTAEEGPIDYSVNLAAFRWFLNYADEQAGRLETQCDLIHDEQVEFEEDFNFLSTKLREADPQGSPVPYNLRLPTANLRALRFEKSEAFLGLQLADCVAAAAMQTIRAPDKRIQEPLQTLLRVGGGGDFTYAFGPENWQADVIVALLGLEYLFSRH